VPAELLLLLLRVARLSTSSSTDIVHGPFDT
jgi:hypothetical protein